MKVRLIAVLLALCWAGCADDAEALKRAAHARANEFPRALASDEVASSYAHAFSMGGYVEKVRIGTTDYLVMFQQGSGVPIMQIGVYQNIIGRWHLVAKPNFGRGEFLQVEVSEGRIVVRAKGSNQTWMIFDPNEKAGRRSELAPIEKSPR